MIRKVKRNFLEIVSKDNFNEIVKPFEKAKVSLLSPPNFQINKFFYKQIGKKYYWIDRLDWSDRDWTNYSIRSDLDTYILKIESDLAGYFELIKKKNETEIAFLGILEEYMGKKLGGYLLSQAIKISWSLSINVKKIKVHTCSLDHKNALKNYISRGMKVCKKEDLLKNFS